MLITLENILKKLLTNTLTIWYNNRASRTVEADVKEILCNLLLFIRNGLKDISKFSKKDFEKLQKSS